MVTLITSKGSFKITDEQYNVIYKIFTDTNISKNYEIKSEKNIITKGDIVDFIVDEKNSENKFYYKVRLSYDDDAEDITITQDELPNVLWSFVNDSKVVTTNGAFRGKDIITILPDFNRIMGWNKGYKPNSTDFALLQRNEKCLQARNYQNKIREICHESKTPQELISRSKQLLIA